MSQDRGAEQNIPISETQEQIKASEEARYVTFTPRQFRELMEKGPEILDALKVYPSLPVGISVQGKVVVINPNLPDPTPLRPTLGPDPVFKAGGTGHS